LASAFVPCPFSNFLFRPGVRRLEPLVFLSRAWEGITRPPLAHRLPALCAVPCSSSCCDIARRDSDRRQRHTATAHRGRPRCHARPGSRDRREPRGDQHTLARNPDTATRHASAPRAATPCVGCRSTHGLPRWASCALPPGGKRSGDAAACGLVCEWAQAHDLNETTPTVPVEFVVPLTIRT